MKKRLQALRNEEGLTLVELLAVIVILAIIAVVAFVMIGQVIANSKTDTHIANAQQMIESTKLYEASEGALDIGDVVTLADLQSSGLIEKPLREPWDNGEITGDTNLVKKDGSAASPEYIVTLEGPEKGCSVKTKKEIQIIDRDKREDVCVSNAP